ncbi:hydrogenase maturation protein [Streptomyces sp. FH025]|uniref:hydrogenase maturation protein n=1 Tax=Streptomyces sp. FH025 TaxID=2815937 RepID=UPI001A9EC693|nr:hydrogenase maturation protein [Streptomyces sp. FH025]MBO1413784.1 hydrogenase maturation protein [Streptomyces sp. FH025]
MRILLLASAFNSLSQRLHAELRDRHHTVDVHVAGDDGELRAAVRRLRPDLVLAPMLRTAIPPDVWSEFTCLIVHPGPPGDRGPSSLDRAIQEGRTEWGVTVLQAEAEMDAGPVWAWAHCRLPERGKSDLYRNEVSDAAVSAALLAVERFASGTYAPQPQHGPGWWGTVRERPVLRQEKRRIDWAKDRTDTVLRKLRAADSQPGVLDVLCGGEWYLHGGHREPHLRGRPGELLATRAGALCRATTDGAVWIPELRRRRAPGGPATFKLPAVTALGSLLPPLPEVAAPLMPGDDVDPGWTDIAYHEAGPAGFLCFSFPGGAMSSDHCRRLLEAYRFALGRPTSVLVLGCGRDFFSNGIHLNVIEAAPDPAAESWANITAMDDLVAAVLTTTDRLVVAAVGGNAAAGGVMLARAADEVWCRAGSVLNPHYRLMGLYGSEYWTYTLPRRVGAAEAERLTGQALPVSAAAAERIGLVDRVLDCGPEEFAPSAAHLAGLFAASPVVQGRIAAKKAARRADERARPLASYREEELAVMRGQFFTPESPYHALRSAFVRKRPAPAGLLSRT